MFTYGSICSGIEAVSVAWDGIGKPLWFAEIEPFPSAVLAYRFPEIPNLGDMTSLPEKILNREIPAPDVLVGGTPCQAFSVAGKRESLDDERGNLTLSLIHILEAIDYVRQQDGQEPCVLIWENVPGVLSTKDNAFGHLLAGLAQEHEPLQPPRGKWAHAGYVHSARTISWRVLDAQYFGVPQRRKRVFLVASARNRSVAQILIEQKSVSGHSTSSGETGENITGFIETSFAQYRPSNVAGTLKASGVVLGGGSETFVIHGTQDPNISQNVAHCLGRNGGQENVLFEIKGVEALRIAHKGVVRKLTPIECERLQGFPDDWTKVPYRNKQLDQCPDSPRYKAIGNSMAVPVMRWIGQRVTQYFKVSW